MPTEEEGVYLFKTIDDAEDMFEEWYSERYDESEKFVLLTIDTSSLTLFSTLVDFEWVSYESIPSSAIINVEIW